MDVVGTSIREIVRVPETMVTVTGLDGNTDYTVRVQARNRDNLGEVARMSFKTAPGVVAPTLTVNTNLDTERYSLSIDEFSTRHGPLRCASAHCFLDTIIHYHIHTPTHTHTHTHSHTHSHYVIYVVESDSRPDTSAIMDTDLIALAFLVSDIPSQIVMGDGQRDTFEAPNDGGDIPYNNRELDAGTIYYFFIRLYSSVVSNVGLCGLVCSTVECLYLEESLASIRTIHNENFMCGSFCVKQKSYS